MDFRLIDKHWDKELSSALAADRSSLRIICPFIKLGPLTSLLADHPIESIQVITRYNLSDFFQGVSDTKALRALVAQKAKVRGIKNLHAKVFMFGKSRVIVTSANLTAKGLSKNHEFGFISSDLTVLEEARHYFDRLWAKGHTDLVSQTIDEWDRKIFDCLVGGGTSKNPNGLGDEGEDAGIAPEIKVPLGAPTEPSQAFVKFLGQANDRVPVDFSVKDEIERAGCHWALCYPASQRPISVRDGATMFIARLTDEPDIRIFGRAIGLAHVPGRDDATPADILKRDWKREWPRYIRVHHAEFIAGTMEHGVSLYEMMSSLGSDSFVATQRHAATGDGNTDPRRAYSQKPAVELTPQAAHWLRTRLDRAFTEHGKVTRKSLDDAGWPQLPLPPAELSRTEKIRVVQRALRKLAQNGIRSVFYDPIMKEIGLDHHLTAHRNEIGDILGNISRRSFREKGVLLSILVHRKEKPPTRPGSGFLDLAKDLGLKWRDEDRFINEQTDLVLRAYQLTA